jgi:hypothetical protein
VTVRAMIITANGLLPRPKLDCDGGYDVAMKGPSIVVKMDLRRMELGFLTMEEIPDDVDIGRFISKFSSNAETIGVVIDIEQIIKDASL